MVDEIESTVTDVDVGQDAPDSEIGDYDASMDGGPEFVGRGEARSIEQPEEGGTESGSPEATVESLQAKLSELEQANQKMTEFISQLTQKQEGPSPEQAYTQATGQQPQQQQQQPSPDPQVGPGPGPQQPEEWLNISDDAIDALIEGDRGKFSKEIAGQMDNRIGQALTNSVAMLGARMHEVVRQEMTMQRFQEQNPHFFENDQKSSKFYENLNAIRATNPNMPFAQQLAGVGIMMNAQSQPKGTLPTNPLTKGNPKQRSTQTPGFAGVGKGFDGGRKDPMSEHMDHVWGHDKRV